MSGLIPEKRMDKNGKLVTRHIQYGGEQPAKSKLLPSVFALFGKDDRYPGKTKEILDAPLEYMNTSERKKLMSTLNDNTMRALHAAGLGPEDDSKNYDDYGIVVVIQTCRKEGSFALLNNIAFFANEDESTASNALTRSVGFVKGLVKYQSSGTERIDYTQASDEELEDARKLLAVAKEMEFKTGGGCVRDGYDFYSGEGDNFIDSPEAVARFRSMDAEEAMEMARFVRGSDMWFQSKAEVQNAFDLFNMRRETHDALDEGVL